jgi:hypothetical protein
VKLIKIEAINSKPDSYGNRYHACRVTNCISGKVLEFKISGDNAHYAAFDLFNKQWDSQAEFSDCSTTELGCRAFDKETKGWPYGGCTGADLAKYIKAASGCPTLFEAAQAILTENGQEWASHYSDLYVPATPIIK